MRGRARNLVPCAAILFLACTAATSSATPGPRAQLASLEGAERSATLELFGAESSLARTRTEVGRLERRRQTLEASLERSRRHVVILRSSLSATHARVATLLRRLYTDGDADPVAVILGARSLPGMLAGIDELERATLANRALASEVATRARALDVRLARLARLRQDLRSDERRARAAVTARAAAVAARRDTITAIRHRAGVTRARLAAIETRAVAAQRASARLERTRAQTPAHRALPAPVSGATPRPAPSPARETSSPELAPPGERTLVVDAVAYHLPGRTASGLPVGVGVIAVDPAVIPLGTRVFVPGYGPAVAADVGSAIRGNLIDLWMPSTAAARAWGRRTVTITVYG